MEIPGSTILVTGGSSGLGAACARRLVAGGASVVIADVNEAAGSALANELGSMARFVRTDVTDEASVQQALATAKEMFGGLRGLISCAGVLGASRVVGKDGPHDLGLF